MTDPAADRFAAEQDRLLKLTGWRRGALTISQRERLRLGALASLQLRNIEARVIRGAAVDSRATAELLATLSDLLPQEAPALRVTFIDRVACPKCMAAMPAEPETPAQVAAPVKPVAERPVDPARILPAPAPEPQPVRRPDVVSFPGAMGFGGVGSGMSRFDNNR